MALRSLLASPHVYRFFCSVIGNGPRQVFVDKYVKPKSGDSILDIGCGPGNLLEYLKDVRYVGLDMNERYIADAKNRYGSRGEFLCEKLGEGITVRYEEFDIIIAFGILHHLDDRESLELFNLAKSKLKGNGRLLTLDVFRYQDQPMSEKMLVSLDRGKYVRTEAEYIDLARKVFGEVRAHKLSGVTRLPYTGIILESMNNA